MFTANPTLSQLYSILHGFSQKISTILAQWRIPKRHRAGDRTINLHFGLKRCRSMF